MGAAEVCALLALGLAGGLISGLVGIGGGLIFVPAFTLLLDLPIVTAAGTSLMTIAIATSAGAWRHDRDGNVNRGDALAIGIFAPLGLLVGITVAHALPEHSLEFAFGCVLIYTGGVMARRALTSFAGTQEDEDEEKEEEGPPSEEPTAMPASLPGAPPPEAVPELPRPAHPVEPPPSAGPSDESSRPPVVVGLGLEPLRLLEGQGRIDCVLETPDRTELPALVDLLQAGVSAGGGVVAIVPQWFPGEGRASFALARRALDDPPLVAVYRTGCPPLAGAVLAACAAALGGRLAGGLGLVTSVLGLVERRLLTLAWLSSVAGLRDPRAPQHLRLLSHAPGTSFVAVVGGPSPVVARARPGALQLQLDPSGAVAVSARRADPARLAAVVPQLAAMPSVAVSATPAGPSWWGTGRLVEAVVYPSDPDWLAQDLLARIDPWECVWCGQLIATSPCPCCLRHGPPPPGARRSQRAQAQPVDADAAARQAGLG
jgi:hypothetical protein